jgi:tripartite-type tricarboxylate transporter receptor subunit TctC
MMRRLLFNLLAGIGLTFSETSAAQSIADFFQGKTVTIYAAASVAGPTEVRARVIAPYLRKYLPGTPNIIVQALPGAGGNRAANNVYNLAPKDGTALGNLQSTIAFNQAIGMSGLQYDARKFSYIGSLDPSGQAVVVSPSTSVRNVDDAKRIALAFGSSGIGSSSWIVPTMANRYLGTQVRLVTGYTGISDLLLALERKEIDGLATNWHSIVSSRPDWRHGRNVVAIAHSGLTRDPELRDTPTLMELAKSDPQRVVFEFYALSSALGVVLVTPPTVPSDRVAALRQAFEKATADPDFIADAKASGLYIFPRRGVELEDIVARTLATPPDVIAEMRDMLGAP